MDLSFDCHGFLSNLHLLSLLAGIVEWLVGEVVRVYAVFIAELASFYKNYALGYNAKDIGITYILIVGFVAIGIPLALLSALQAVRKNPKQG